MAYGEDNFEDTGSRSPASLDDVRQQIDHNRAKLGDIQITTDARTGDGYVLGFKVPKNVRPFIELGLENIKPYVIDQSDRIYQNSVKLAGKVGFKGAHMNTVGAVVENLFRWGVIGAQPISGFAHASKVHSDARKKLYRELAPVMEATKADAHNNEVIKAAFDAVHNDWVSDMKMLAADIPTLVPMAMIGAQDQVAAGERHRKAKAKSESEAQHRTAGAKVDPKTQKWNEIKARVNEEREKFINDNIGEGKEFENRRAAGEHFDQYLRSEVTEYHRNYDDHDAHAPGTDDGKNEAMLKFAVPLTSAASQVIKSNVQERAGARRRNPNAWDMIKHLKQQIDEQCGANGIDCEKTMRSAEDIVVTLPNGRGEVALKDYIVEVFKQNEIDNGRSGLGNNLVEQLGPSVDLIAQHIADGSLDANALVNLVGENKVIVHSGSARRFASKEQVREAIDKLEPVLGTPETLRAEDFFANFADPRLVEQTLKKNLATMKGEEKALFAALFPDEILEQAGIKKHEVVELRKTAHQHMTAFVAASALHIADKDPKAVGLSENDMKAIADFAEKIKAGDREAVAAAVNGRNKAVISAMRTAELNEQVATGKNPWTERVKEMGAVQRKIEAEAKDSVIASASKRIGDGLDEVPLPVSAQERELKRRQSAQPDEGVGIK
jgi:hypothetical protein